MSKQNKAFTLLEAVMVIVLIGILATVAIPRLQTDTTQDAASQILSDIRYTQHLALTDDVTNPNDPNWQRAFWTIQFRNQGTTTGWTYTVASDKNMEGNFAQIEAALDPLSGLPIFGNTVFGDRTVSQKVFIGRKYGITAVDFTQCGGGQQHVGFDRLGRLHQGYTNPATGGSTSPNYASVLHTPCIITFAHPNGDFSINIQPETGYAYIVGQENQ